MEIWHVVVMTDRELSCKAHVEKFSDFLDHMSLTDVGFQWVPHVPITFITVASDANVLGENSYLTHQWLSRKGHRQKVLTQITHRKYGISSGSTLLAITILFLRDESFIIRLWGGGVGGRLHFY